MPVQGSITQETREVLKNNVDDMCALITDLNAQNYELFIKARDAFIERLNQLTHAYKD